MQEPVEGGERLSVSQTLQRFRQMEKLNKERETKEQQSTNPARRLSGRKLRAFSVGLGDRAKEDGDTVTEQTAPRTDPQHENAEAVHRTDSPNDESVADESREGSGVAQPAVSGQESARGAFAAAAKLPSIALASEGALSTVGSIPSQPEPGVETEGAQYPLSAVLPLPGSSVDMAAGAPAADALQPATASQSSRPPEPEELEGEEDREDYRTEHTAIEAEGSMKHPATATSEATGAQAAAAAGNTTPTQLVPQQPEPVAEVEAMPPSEPESTLQAAFVAAGTPTGALVEAAPEAEAGKQPGWHERAPPSVQQSLQPLLSSLLLADDAVPSVSRSEAAMAAGGGLSLPHALLNDGGWEMRSVSPEKQPHNPAQQEAASEAGVPELSDLDGSAFVSIGESSKAGVPEELPEAHATTKPPLEEDPPEEPVKELESLEGLAAEVDAIDGSRSLPLSAATGAGDAAEDGAAAGATAAAAALLPPHTTVNAQLAPALLSLGPDSKSNTLSNLSEMWQQSAEAQPPPDDPLQLQTDSNLQQDETSVMIGETGQTKTEVKDVTVLQSNGSSHGDDFDDSGDEVLPQAPGCVATLPNAAIGGAQHDKPRNTTDDDDPEFVDAAPNTEPKSGQAQPNTSSESDGDFDSRQTPGVEAVEPQTSVHTKGEGDICAAQHAEAAIIEARESPHCSSSSQAAEPLEGCALGKQPDNDIGGSDNSSDHFGVMRSTDGNTAEGQPSSHSDIAGDFGDFGGNQAMETFADSAQQLDADSSDEDRFGDFDAAQPAEEGETVLSDSDDSFGEFDTAQSAPTEGTQPAMSVVGDTPPAASPPSLQGGFRQQQQQREDLSGPSESQTAESQTPAGSTVHLVTQTSILQLQGDAFETAVADLMASALFPLHCQHTLVQHVPLPQLAELAGGWEPPPPFQAGKPFTSHGSPARARLLRQLGLQEAAAAAAGRHGGLCRYPSSSSSSGIHSQTSTLDARRFQGGHISGGVPPKAPSSSSSSRHLRSARGAHCRSPSGDSSGSGEADIHIAAALATTTTDATLPGSASDPGLYATGLDGSGRGGRGGGVHRMGLPTGKAVPVFRSLSRGAGDGKAPPKRRLSKFGTPDVNRPTSPEVLLPPAPLPPPPLPPPQTGTSLPHWVPHVAVPPTTISHDPFAAFASHDLMGEARVVAAASAEVQAVEPPGVASDAAPDTFANTAADGIDEVGQFFGAEATNSSSSAFATTAADGIDEVGQFFGAEATNSSSSAFATTAANGIDKVGQFFGAEAINSSSSAFVTTAADGIDEVGQFFGAKATNSSSSAFAAASNQEDPFSGVRQKLPLDSLRTGAVSAVHDLPLPQLQAALNGGSDAEHVDPMYYTLPQHSLHSQELKDSVVTKAAAGAAASLTPSRSDPLGTACDEKRQHSPLPLIDDQNSNDAASAEAVATEAQDFRKAPASQWQPSRVDHPDKSHDATVLYGLGAMEPAGGISGEQVAEGSTRSKDAGPIAAAPNFFLKLPPTRQQVRDVFADTTTETASPQPAVAAAFDVFAGQESLVSTLNRRCSVTFSDSEFGDFEGPSSPAALIPDAATSLVDSSSVQPTLTVLYEGSDDDFGEFMAQEDEATQEGAAPARQHPLQQQSQGLITTVDNDLVPSVEHENLDKQPLDVHGQSARLATGDMQTKAAQVDAQINGFEDEKLDKDPFADLW